MKFFSIDTVISSFEDNKNKATDVFWGIMAILRSLDCKIEACVQYNVNSQKVANFLECWFSVRNEYKNYNTSATWYAVFSSKWVEQLSLFLKATTNIYSVIAWMYQHYEFETTPTYDELLTLFCKETSIEYEYLSSLFDMSKRPLNFSDSKFTHSEKLKCLSSRYGHCGGNNSVKSNGSYIVAEAGAFQRAPFIQTLYASSENYKCLMFTSIAPHVYYPSIFKESKQISLSNISRQVIYFGAPGTGKSRAVNDEVKEKAPNNNIRTTFHPDSDYSSFVGCYKPTMKNGNIEYSFTPQAFIKAYIGAWNDTNKPFYLIIEEINRGNCAQIFGDIFQLLDRNQHGESTYGIQPDADLQLYIAQRLGMNNNIPSEIAKGVEMRLPSNLFIYATMNTSDQSLFPIDAAFKRRWDWKYTSIRRGEREHILKIGNNNYFKWSSFIEKVNKKIFDLTKSEDKQLGYWFILPDENNIIDCEVFTSKALFYIWNDVVKDYATMEKANSPFGVDYAFTKFFDGNGKVIIEHVIAFLNALEVENYTEIVSNGIRNDIDNSSEEILDDIVEENDHSSLNKGSAFSYTLNGVDFTGIGKVIQHIVKTLCKSKRYVEIEADFNRIVKKTYNKESAIQPLLPSDLNPDEKGRNRWYSTPFSDIEGKKFSLISLWPDSSFDRIKDWVANYPDIFPSGIQQHKNS